MSRKIYWRAVCAAAALLIAFGACACDIAEPSSSASFSAPTSSEDYGSSVEPVINSISSSSDSVSEPVIISTVEAVETDEPTQTEQSVQTEQTNPSVPTDEPNPEQTSEASSQTTAASTTQTTTQITTQTTTTKATTTTAKTTKSTTTAKTTKATTTTTTQPEKPPAEVVIPEVKKPSSPGTDTFVGGDGVIDYSNASKGYISVSYSGKSDKLKLRLTCGSGVSDHTIDPGDVEYIPLTLGNGSYSVELYERVDGKKYALLISESMSVSISDEVGMYLYPNKYCMFSKSSKSVKKGAEICAGKSGTIEKIGAIFTWITDNVSYDNELAANVQAGYVATPYVPDPDYTLSVKKGICYDYSALMAAMARSQGIPTRIAIGYAGDIYHAWVEVWTDETGWITPEILLSKKGYNRLDPTFYSGASDKKAIVEYITENIKYSTMLYY